MSKLSERDFFKLVDDVLVEAGRRPLESTNRSIIKVQPQDRVLQILAGPGSGKTEMLVWRVLYELLVRDTLSSRVMVTTFTRKAATELEVRVVERCDALLRKAHERKLDVPDPQVHDLRIGTIHSLCDALLAEFDPSYMEQGIALIDEFETTLRMARSYRLDIGFTNGKGAPRTVDRLVAAGQLIALFREPWSDHERWPANEMQRVSYLLALLGQHTETWIPRCADISKPNGVEVLHNITTLTEDLNKLRKRWSAYLAKNNILDFTSIQHKFLERQDVLLSQLDHVLVDEFQDTNPIQFAIHTKWLESPKTRLTIVGDDDQAMYRFRGSDIHCFTALQPHAESRKIPFRLERLEKNWRSTRTIVGFSQHFHRSSVLDRVSMKKSVVAGDDAAAGERVRLLRGSWTELCKTVAEEIAKRAPKDGGDPSTALLFFSTSEKSSKKRGPSPALELRTTLERRKLRVYNARNKTAGSRDSPVAELLGLLSYLVDPITNAPAGKRGGMVMVSASDSEKADHAKTAPPTKFRVNGSHLTYQKHFVKGDGGNIGSPVPDRKVLLDYLDEIREQLAVECAKAQKMADDAAKRGEKVKPGGPRLTMSGLVARLLSFPRFRSTGYTVKLFRQALFTELLEANIAPSRMTMKPLDRPLSVTKENGKYKWPDEIWSFISTFGSMLDETDLDDPEVEAFEEGAVSMMTFHQSKGLEFDHVYVACTGRDSSPHNVLRTLVFSGEVPKYQVANGQPVCKDQHVLDLADADRERELYVALTRAKKTLTILFDPKHGHPLMKLNPVLDQLIKGLKGKRYSSDSPVEVLELPHA